MAVLDFFELHQTLWEPGLPAMGTGLSAFSLTDTPPAIAGKPAPTGVLAVLDFFEHHQTLWEPGLPAMGTGLSAFSLTDTPPAIAGKPAPTGLEVIQEIDPLCASMHANNAINIQLHLRHHPPQ
ncbi:hypothetical protein [Pseudomonas monsensis]